MFGETPGVSRLKVCCGPRCGVWPGHRAIYAAAERAAAEQDTATLPTMCQGLCGNGVTLVLPGGDKVKAGDAREAAEAANTTALPEPISVPSGP